MEEKIGVTEYINQKKELYNQLLCFIDNDDDISDEFHNIIDKFNPFQSGENYSESKIFFRLIIIISNEHNRKQSFYNKIEQILQQYKEKIKQFFSKTDIFDIFSENKRILLFLLNNQIISVEDLISNYQKKDEDFWCFFYPEIKDHIPQNEEKLINKKISNLDSSTLQKFNELRLIGENESYLCSLIREDLVEKFIIHSNECNLSLTKTTIKPSLFETNLFLTKFKQISLIEYASFFGSIQIFQYLKLNGVKLNSSLWIFAIHGRNAEIIRYLEEEKVIPSDETYRECLEESIKCHHNEIAEFLIDNYINLNEEKISISMKYQNYFFLPETENEIKNILPILLCSSCEYDYKNLLLILVKEKIEIDSDKAFESCCKNMEFAQILLDNQIIEIDAFKKCEALVKLVIPSFITEIKPSSFRKCKSLTEITIPSSVKVIGSKAFKWCYSMRQIIIPSSVTTINDSAFSGCLSLRKIIIPSSVNFIGSYAFCSCIELKQISIPESLTVINQSTFFECSALTQIKIPSSVTSIENYAFLKCTSLKKVILPPSLVKIGDSAFGECQKLTSITIPSCLEFLGDSVFENCYSLSEILTESKPIKIHIGEKAFLNCKELKKIPDWTFDNETIGEETFSGCSSLKQIKILGPITSICNSAFAKCSSLVEITIPMPVTSIGIHAFYGCKLLKQIDFLGSLKTINRYCFRDCSSLEKITIPSTVESIEEHAFDTCKSLTEILIPSSVVSIDNCAFSGCSSLKKILIPKSIKKIGKSIFEYCSSLIEITFLNYMTSINDEFFFSCKSLSEVTIPSTVTCIGKNSFTYCSSLKKITIPSSVTKIDQGAFSSCFSLTEMTIPSSVKEVGASVFEDCHLLTKISILSNLTEIPNKMFSGCFSLKEINIPSSVSLIDDYSFTLCSSLQEITIPSSVTKIGDCAFSGCSSLTKISITSSFTELSNCTFSGCLSLTEISIPSSNTQIKRHCFSGCASLTKITIPSSVTKIKYSAFSECSSLTELIIPSSVRKIGKNAFSGCKSLKKIIIPSSVTNIGYFAFWGCFSLDLNSIPSEKGDNLFDDSLTIFKDMKIDCPYQLKENIPEIRDYEIIDKISNNSICQVFKATNKKTKEICAIKFYRNFVPINYINIYFSFALTNLNIPGIVKIRSYQYPLFDNRRQDICFISYKKDMIDITGYIIIKDFYKNGSLREITKEYLETKGGNQSKMNPTIRSKIIFGIAAIMKKIHRMNIVHQNLSIGNILLDDNFEPLINNFGFAGSIGGPFEEVFEMCDESMRVNNLWDLIFYSPERFEGIKDCFQSDVYSYAVILYLMFENRLYSTKKNIVNMRNIIQRKIVVKTENIPEHYWELITKCMKEDPCERPSFDQITNMLKDDSFALDEFGMKTDLNKLHEYQNRIDCE